VGFLVLVWELWPPTCPTAGEPYESRALKKESNFDIALVVARAKLARELCCAQACIVLKDF
jgi:hypothetical protein